jgi:hypothetical protein
LIPLNAPSRGGEDGRVFRDQAHDQDDESRNGGQLGKPLTIEGVSIPVPRPGKVLVRIMATGVCHTAV